MIRSATQEGGPPAAVDASPEKAHPTPVIFTGSIGRVGTPPDWAANGTLSVWGADVIWPVATLADGTRAPGRPMPCSVCDVGSPASWRCALSSVKERRAQPEREPLIENCTPVNADASTQSRKR